MADEYMGAAHDDALAWVFQGPPDKGQALALLVRYEATLTRSYDRAFKQLLLLQSARHRPQPNEPETDPLKPDQHHPKQPEPNRFKPGSNPTTSAIATLPLDPRDSAPTDLPPGPNAPRRT